MTTKQQQDVAFTATEGAAARLIRLGRKMIVITAEIIEAREKDGKRGAYRKDTVTDIQKQLGALQVVQDEWMLLAEQILPVNPPTESLKEN